MGELSNGLREADATSPEARDGHGVANAASAGSQVLY